MDVCVVAAHTIYQQGNDESHYVFKREPAYEVSQPCVLQRSKSSHSNENMKQAMIAVVVNPTSNIIQDMELVSTSVLKHGHCKLCPKC
jgi:hypothetical protein